MVPVDSRFSVTADWSLVSSPAGKLWRLLWYFFLSWESPICSSLSTRGKTRSLKSSSYISTHFWSPFRYDLAQTKKGLDIPKAFREYNVIFVWVYLLYKDTVIVMSGEQNYCVPLRRWLNECNVCDKLLCMRLKQDQGVDVLNVLLFNDVLFLSLSPSSSHAGLLCVSILLLPKQWGKQIHIRLLI